MSGNRKQGRGPKYIEKWSVASGQWRAKTTLRPGVSSLVRWGVRCQILSPDSCLLTSVLQEMKVHPEMLMKTHDRERGTRENGTRGVRILASALPGTPAPVRTRRACAGDGISWEHGENKGTPEPNHPSQIAIRQWPDSCLLAPGSCLPSHSADVARLRLGQNGSGGQTCKVHW